MADLVGPTEATRVGALIDAPAGHRTRRQRCAPSTSTPGTSPSWRQVRSPWGRPAIDVQLDDGVGEIDTAALLEVYSYSQAATSNAISATGTVTTRHGLVMRTLPPEPPVPTKSSSPVK